MPLHSNECYWAPKSEIPAIIERYNNGETLEDKELSLLISELDRRVVLYHLFNPPVNYGKQ